MEALVVNFRRLVLLLLALALLDGSNAVTPVGRSAPEGLDLVRVPEGFRRTIPGPGVVLYRKDYPGGKPDFVQVTNLWEGTSIGMFHGPVAVAGAGDGDNPSFRRQRPATRPGPASAGRPCLFCLSNWQFFSTNDNPTPLAFPLKKEGVIVMTSATDLIS